MRYPPRYWLLGEAASVIVHGLIIAAVANTKTEIRIERGAGATVIVTTLTTTRAIAGENSVAALESAEPEAEPPTPTDAEVDPARPDTTAPHAPAEAVEAPVSKPKELAARTPGQQVSATVPERIPTVSAAVSVGEVRPGESQEPIQRDEVQPSSDATNRSPEAPESPEALQNDATPATIVTAVAAESARLTEAQAVPADATFDAVGASEPTLVQPEEAKSPTPMIAKPREVIAPVKPREKAVEKRQEVPERKSKKTAKKRKKSKPRKSGRQRVASVRRSGSTSRGRSTRVAGDGGRNRTATGSANISNYLGKIVSRLQRQKRYPSGAKRKKLQGTAVITFTVKSNGRVGGVRLRRSSGHAVLDREVQAMLRRAAPFPPIPKSSKRRALSLSVPITFRVR